MNSTLSFLLESTYIKMTIIKEYNINLFNPKYLMSTKSHRTKDKPPPHLNYTEPEKTDKLSELMTKMSCFWIWMASRN